MKLTNKIDLALKIERFVGYDNVKYIDSLKRIYPKEKFGIFEFEGGVSCFAGLESPFSNSLGFGLDNYEENEIILQRIEDFYRQYSQTPRISIADVCVERTQTLLSEKNYQLFSSANVYTRDLTMLNPYHGEVAVKLCQSGEQINSWIHVLSEGFNGSSEAPDTITLGQSQKAGNTLFLAFYNEKAIAGASLYVENGMARLGGMVTLKEHRLQGAQTALIAHRLASAQKLGCTLATTEAEPESKSQNNLEKAGFNFMYARNVFQKTTV